MKKILINKCYGGFDLSSEAKEMLLNKLSIPFERKEAEAYGMIFTNPETGEELCVEDIDRDNPLLIEVVETLGVEASSGDYAELKIVEIPDDVVWEIEENFGNEWVSEIHRTWE